MMFAIGMFVGMLLGVFVASLMHVAHEPLDVESCPHNQDWDDCPDCRH